MPLPSLRSSSLGIRSLFQRGDDEEEENATEELDVDAFPDVRASDEKYLALLPASLTRDKGEDGWQRQLDQYLAKKDRDFDNKGVVSYLTWRAKARLDKKRRLKVEFTAGREDQPVRLEMGSPNDVIQWAIDPSTPNANGSGPHHFPIVRTPNLPNSAVTLRFDKFAVKPTMYSFRHGWHNSYYAMRSWVFEAKQEGSEEWFVVREHKEDGIETPFSVKDAFSPVSFEVRGKFYASEVRIRQTANNSGGYDDLYISGFEVYGKLKKS